MKNKGIMIGLARVNNIAIGPNRGYVLVVQEKGKPTITAAEILRGAALSKTAAQVVFGARPLGAWRLLKAAKALERAIGCEVKINPAALAMAAAAGTARADGRDAAKAVKEEAAADFAAAQAALDSATTVAEYKAAAKAAAELLKENRQAAAAAKKDAVKASWAAIQAARVK